METNVERRFRRGTVEMRGAGGARKIAGYGAVFYDGSAATEYELYPGAVERILEGAFGGLEGADVVSLFNHEPSLILGRTAAGTLRLEVDSRGLRYEVDLGETQVARDVREHVQRGDVSGSSFAFQAIEDRWRRENGKDVREIRRVKLFDVGPVVEPAYAATSAEARAVGSAENLREEAIRRLAEEDQAARAERRQAIERLGVLTGRGAARLERALARQVERRALGGWEHGLERRRCGEALMGLWAIEPRYLQAAWDLFAAGRYPLVRSEAEEEEPAARPAEREYALYGGVAIIRIVDHMTKRASSLGGTSTIRVRRQMRQAAADREVSAILLAIDSPGGTVAGTDDLAAEIRRTIRRGKRVHAYIEDLGASAAYWAASQALRISAGPMAEVGSIGVLAIVYDLSKQFHDAGIRVEVVSTGPRKGDFAPGAVVTDEALSSLRRSVEEHGEHFVAAVARGRRVSPEKVREWATGEVWGAETAREMGLIDALERFDDAVDAVRHQAALDRAEKEGDGEPDAS